MTSFVTNKPDGDTIFHTVDNEILQMITALVEIQDVDHYWPVSANTVDHADRGMHRQITFQAVISPAAPAAGKAIAYILGDPEELVFQNDTNSVQLTKGGKLNLTGTYDQTVTLSNEDNSYHGNQQTFKNGGRLGLPKDTTNTSEGNCRYNLTNKTVEYRTDTAWLALLAATGACKIKVGTYTGDTNGTQAVTEVGFQPDVVVILPESSSHATVKTSSMGVNAKKLSGGAYGIDAIVSLDADGFTVGDGTGFSDVNNNSSGVVYHYIALQVVS